MLKIPFIQKKFAGEVFFAVILLLFLMYGLLLLEINHGFSLYTLKKITVALSIVIIVSFLFRMFGLIFKKPKKKIVDIDFEIMYFFLDKQK